MSLAVLIPYRPDTPHRERIHGLTSKLWAATGYEVVYCDDGLEGLFSFSTAANRARKLTNADCLLVYCVDALPLSGEVLERIHAKLSSGVPWVAVFDGQQRFTGEQTAALLDGATPDEVGPAEGQVCPGREALIGVRADVWDALRGMDERFVGWGPEDFAFHLILQTAYPNGDDTPTEGLFQSLGHDDTPRTMWGRNTALWGQYRGQFPQKLLPWYLSR